MRVVGFTFIKNAIKYDFPIVEAIQSIMPICDEIVVALGDSTDETNALIASIPGNIRTIDTVWDESLINGGAVLADETNKVLKAIDAEADWCFYIQGDEVVHEQDLPHIKAGMETYSQDDRVDGLLFHYRHFYGSYDYIGSSAKWYRNEIRVIKNNRNIYSYKDAQGFRKDNNDKLNVAKINAFIYHYGWVKPPEIMLQKVRNDELVRFGNETPDLPVVDANEAAFDYGQIDLLTRFNQTHPAVMIPRIERTNWTFDRDISHNRMTMKERIKRWSEKILGYPIGEYRNYKITRTFSED